jgi:hypothetical protein
MEQVFMRQANKFACRFFFVIHPRYIFLRHFLTANFFVINV